GRRARVSPAPARNLPGHGRDQSRHGLGVLFRGALDRDVVAAARTSVVARAPRLGRARVVGLVAPTRGSLPPGRVRARDVLRSRRVSVALVAHAKAAICARFDCRGPGPRIADFIGRSARTSTLILPRYSAYRLSEPPSRNCLSFTHRPFGQVDPRIMLFDSGR